MVTRWKEHGLRDVTGLGWNPHPVPLVHPCRLWAHDLPEPVSRRSVMVMVIATSVRINCYQVWKDWTQGRCTVKTVATKTSQPAKQTKISTPEETGYLFRSCSLLHLVLITAVLRSPRITLAAILHHLRFLLGYALSKENQLSRIKNTSYIVLHSGLFDKALLNPIMWVFSWLKSVHAN